MNSDEGNYYTKIQPANTAFGLLAGYKRYRMGSFDLSHTHLFVFDFMRRQGRYDISGL